MKKLISLLGVLLIAAISTMAQVPGGFKYQTVIRDATGNVLAHEDVSIGISILQGGGEGIEVFTEMHDTITNGFGLVNLDVGFSDPSAFAAIDWSLGAYYIRISINDEVMATSQLLSVPYALYAGSAGSGSGGSGADGDSDPFNELQDISLSGSELSISQGSTVDLKPLMVSLDNQTLSVVGNKLTINNGNTVTLPDQVNDADYDPTNEIELPGQTMADANKVLKADGAGNVSWQSGGGSSITAVGSMTSGNTFAGTDADDNWLGLGSSAGRIEFDDQATDEINILDANVGIGTSTPSLPLEVNGQIGFVGDTRQGIAKIYNASAGDVYGIEQVGSGQSGISRPEMRLFTSDYGSAGIGFGKYTNATNFVHQMVIDHDGHVGIGATTPANTLDVNGSGNFGDILINKASAYNTGSTAYNDGFIELYRTADDGAYIDFKNASEDYDWRIQARNDLNTLLFSGGNFSFTGGNVGIGSDGTDGQLTIYSEQGTTDYSVVFQPHAAMTATTTYTLPADDGTASQVLTTDGSGALSWTTPAGGNSIVDADNDTKIQVEESADEDIIRFDVGGTEAMFIDNFGNLSLNTSNPSDGKLTIATGGGTDETLISFDEGAIGGSSGSNFKFVGKFAGTGTDNAFALEDFNGNTNMIWTAAGNVGIGDATPDFFLDVAGTFGADGAITTGSNGTDGSLTIYSEQGTTDYSVIFQPHAAMTAATTYTLPADDGTASQVLTTDGSGALSWSTTSLNSIADADNDTKIQVEESANENHIRFDVAGNQAMAIDNTGQLGIGAFTTDSFTPDALLHTYSGAQNAEVIFASKDGNYSSSVYIAERQATGNMLGARLIYGGENNTFQVQLGTSTDPDNFESRVRLHRDNDQIELIGDVTIGDDAGSKAGTIALHDADATDSYTTTLVSNADVAADFTLTLPADDGDANQVLTTDGSGALSWSAPGSGDIDGLSDARKDVVNNNLFLGHDGGSVGANDDYNTAVGIGALDALDNTTGLYNTALGYNALTATTSGDDNVAIGYNALSANTTGSVNVAIGSNALLSNTTGHSNIAIGQDALHNNTSGMHNTASGYQVLYHNTTGLSNTASGYRALHFSTTGDNNTATGYQSLYLNTSGHSNVVSGYQALYSNTTGTNNTAIGRQAGYEHTTGSGNTFLGYNTGRGITTGSGNTIIGAGVTGLSASLSNNIIIADGAGNRRINVDASGNVGIGTSAPNAMLHISGDVLIDDGTTTTNRLIFDTDAGDPVAMPNKIVLHSVYGFGVSDSDLDIQTDQNIRFYEEVSGTPTERMTIRTGGNVGIGDATPDFLLDVAGTFGTDGSIQTGTDGTDGQLTIYSEQGPTDYSVVFQPHAAMTAATTYTLPADDGDANQVLTTDGSGALNWTTPAGGGDITAVGDALNGEAFTEDGAGNTLYFEGTTADIYELALTAADLTSDITLTLPADDGDAGEALITDGSGILSWTNVNNISDADSDTKIQVEEGTDDDHIRFDVAGNQAMAIDNTGQVGIGAFTTDSFTPGALLHTYSGATNAEVIFASKDGNYTSSVYMAERQATGTMLGTRLRYGLDNTFEIQTGNNSGADNFKTRIKLYRDDDQIDLIGDVVVGDGSIAKAGTIALHDADASDSFTTTLASNADVAANFTLTLPADDGTANQVLTTDGSGALSWSTPAGGGDITSVGSMTNGDAFADATADDDWLGLGASAGRIEFDDQLTDEVNILNANVGIGTASPGKPLVVQSTNSGHGMLQIVRNSIIHGEASIGLLHSSDASDAEKWVIGTGSEGSGSTDDFFFYRSGHKMTINSNGNVGIGTTTPSSKLDIVLGDTDYGGIRFEGENFSASDGATRFLIKDRTGNTDWLLSANNDGSFGVHQGGAGDRLAITNTGNVGIGTTAFGTNAATVLAIANGTAPTTSITDGVQLYAEDVSTSSELKVRDEAGNISTLSPHNFSLLEKSEPMAWSFYSENSNVGQRINVDMLKTVRLIEKISGEQLVYTEDMETGKSIDKKVETGEVEELKKQIEQLKAENETIKAEFEALKQIVLQMAGNK